MKVKCIDSGGSASLTTGNVYDVRGADRNKITILNDKGRQMAYFARRFTPVRDEPQADQWDASRGPKMASPAGKAIFKYQMPVLEQFEMKLPKDASIIRMEDQGGMFWLWAVVDTKAPDETRKFRAFKTGASIPDNFHGPYVGFCKIHVQQELGLYIFEDTAR
jgi:hypothetical protein